MANSMAYSMAYGKQHDLLPCGMYNSLQNGRWAYNMADGPTILSTSYNMVVPGLQHGVWEIAFFVVGLQHGGMGYSLGGGA